MGLEGWLQDHPDVSLTLLAVWVFLKLWPWMTYQPPKQKRNR